MNLHRALMKMFKGIVNIVEDNIYTIKYLTEFEGEDDNKDNIGDNSKDDKIKDKKYNDNDIEMIN